MKTQFVSDYLINKNLSFKGHSAGSDETGVTVHKFYLPYDTDRYSVELELLPFEDVKGKWKPLAGNQPVKYALPKNGVL